MADQKISQLTNYTTPLDADEFVILDDANAITKKVTFANLKLTITPPGLIAPYAGSSAPSGWLLCNGATVSQTTYADLFAITSHTYGSDPGGGNFILPNLKGKVPVGLNASETEFDTLGETGGEKTHQLTIAEMPAHTHTSVVGTTEHLGAVSADIDQLAAGNTGSAGSDTAHNNLQPYLTINYIIKT